MTNLIACMIPTLNQSISLSACLSSCTKIATECDYNSKLRVDNCSKVVTTVLLYKYVSKCCSVLAVKLITNGNISTCCLSCFTVTSTY